ncbi:MAG: FAD-dependent oxidoreductase [bacterium]|nr:MAG: FAD-dependent oxidoreductase [bacterium]
MKSEASHIIVRIPGQDERWELVALETSPCTLACPTRINARGYVTLIADGRHEEALALIRERNPFPGVCGRICPSPCEAACRRGAYDEPVAICALKRFVFDLEMKRGIDSVLPFRVTRDERVAVIGGGPAGLSAALDLSLLGYPVTVFEARDELGGMMNLIPAFRLPGRIIRREVRLIVGRGIEVVTGTSFGKDIDTRWLKRRGYKAVLLATGAWSPSWRYLNPGEGIVHALDVLRAGARYARGEKVPDTGRQSEVFAGRRAVVVGNGMMALDTARTAVRLGCRTVTLVTGISKELSPLNTHERGLAVEEGVTVIDLARPVKVQRRGRTVTGMTCRRLGLGRADGTGRRRVIEIDRELFTVPADIVIEAAGRAIDLGRIRRPIGLDLTPVGTVLVEGDSMQAAPGGIFAAGDMVSGPRSVVEAIASGQKAARGIHAYLCGGPAVSLFDPPAAGETAVREYSIERVPAVATRRAAVPVEKKSTRRKDFREVQRGFPEEAARAEAQRCLRCGPCDECTVCTDICDKKDLQLIVADDLALTVHAGRDLWELHPGRVTLETEAESTDGVIARTIARVRSELCIGCGRCESVCGYTAVRIMARPNGSFISEVSELACKGCGNCVAVCPTGAMDQVNFERHRLARRLEAVESKKTKVLFICRWARPERMELPGHVLVVETMCTGRLTPGLLVEAVRRGSTGVMVCGCEEDRCHYGSGRILGSRTVECARKVLELLGYDPRIVQECSCGPAEFRRVVVGWARRRPRGSKKMV